MWINCTGLTNYLYLEFDHVVQSELFGLSLTKPGTVARQPYYVEFELIAGSNVEQLDFYFDGILDTGTTWDEASLKGLSSYHPDGDLYPGIHDILIVMANAVSEASRIYYIILQNLNRPFC